MLDSQIESSKSANNIERTDTLNDCPFCGPEGQPFVVRIGNEHTKDRGADVGCRECGLTKHIRVIRYSCDWAEQRALEWWNTRAVIKGEIIDNFNELHPHSLAMLRKEVQAALVSPKQLGMTGYTDEASQAIIQLFKDYLKRESVDQNLQDAKDALLKFGTERPACAVCEGTGRTKTTGCYGMREITCPACHGSGN